MENNNRWFVVDTPISCSSSQQLLMLIRRPSSTPFPLRRHFQRFPIRRGPRPNICTVSACTAHLERRSRPSPEVYSPRQTAWVPRVRWHWRVPTAASAAGSTPAEERRTAGLQLWPRTAEAESLNENVWNRIQVFRGNNRTTSCSRERDGDMGAGGVYF